MNDLYFFIIFAFFDNGQTLIKVKLLTQWENRLPDFYSIFTSKLKYLIFKVNS
jgi:hypothetical protein